MAPPLVRVKKEVNTATLKIHQYSQSLEKQIKKNAGLLEKEKTVHFEIISTLVKSLESKDSYVHSHSVRVTKYLCIFGKKLGFRGPQLANLRYAGLLHDIGKLMIDKSILNKKTKLTKAEKKILRKHPAIGSKIISSIRFLRSSSPIILYNHERWDGKGYPKGISGKKIPLPARMLAIVDAYDAMTTRREYGHELSKTEAISELKKNSGTQFDPELVKVFIELLKTSHIKAPKSKSSLIKYAKTLIQEP